MASSETCELCSVSLLGSCVCFFASLVVVCNTRKDRRILVCFLLSKCFWDDVEAYLDRFSYLSFSLKVCACIANWTGGSSAKYFPHEIHTNSNVSCEVRASTGCFKRSLLKEISLCMDLKFPF